MNSTITCENVIEVCILAEKNLILLKIGPQLWALILNISPNNILTLINIIRDSMCTAKFSNLNTVYEIESPLYTENVRASI